jgi:hypothetical protein
MQGSPPPRLDSRDGATVLEDFNLSIVVVCRTPLIVEEA